MKNLIGLRTYKTAIGAALAILIAELLGLKYAVAAGIITILSVQNSKKTSFVLAFQRLEATVLALFIATVLFYLFGFSPMVFGIYLILFIPLTVALKITDGIVVSSVLVTHLLAEKSISQFWLVNEFLLMVVGAGIGILLNLYMPKLENEIKQLQHEVEFIIRKILFNMADSLRLQKVAIHEEELFLNLEKVLKDGIERTLIQLNNYLISDVKYYTDYMKMRSLQLEILKYMRSHFTKFYMTVEQTELVAAFTEKVASEFSENNTGEELLKELAEITSSLKEQELPKTRDEFENRAMLFQFLNDLQVLLEIKRDFIIMNMNLY